MGVKAREKVPGSGDWYVFINWHGVRRAVRVLRGKGAKRRAEKQAEQIRARLTLGDRTDLQRSQQPAVPSFEAFATEWLTWYPAMHSVKPTTLENYRSSVRTHLVSFFGKEPVSSITAERIEAFIEAKRAPGGSARFQGKPLSDASLRTALLPLHLILKRAVRRKYLAGNPMADVEWRGVARIEMVDPFTGAELRAILKAAEAIDPDQATMLRLWMQTGMRAGEVAGLQWQDLDLERGAAMVQRTWTRQRVGSTKTGRGRLVSLLHPTIEDAAEWRPGAGGAALTVLVGLRRLKVQGIDPPTRSSSPAAPASRCPRRKLIANGGGSSPRLTFAIECLNSSATRSPRRYSAGTLPCSTFSSRVVGEAPRSFFGSMPPGSPRRISAQSCNHPQPRRNRSR